MVCAFCGLWGRNLSRYGDFSPSDSVPVCPRCAHSLRPVGPMMVGDVAVRSVCEHSGAARTAVHALKYHGIEAVAARLAPLVVSRLPVDTAALVPVPRARARLIRYRIDPAVALATAAGRLAGIPVVETLRPPLVRTSQVRQRRAVVFAQRETPPADAVLVDDVLTTGATIVAAGRASGITSAVTVTRATAPHGPASV